MKRLPPALLALLFLLADGCLAPSRPPARTPFQVGREAAAAGDYAAAVAQFTLAAENSEGEFFTDAYLERGESHVRLARETSDPVERESHREQALEDFRSVLAEPDTEAGARARALWNEGSLLVESKQDTGKAEAAFLQVLDLSVPPEARSYKLEAYRKLGWMYLEAAGASTPLHPKAKEELAIQEKFRAAQRAFAQGLELRPDDADLNLGKGLCLHFRGQHDEAITYLRKSTEESEAHGEPNPRGHFYLARALEFKKGLQEAALEHHARALEQDTDHTFTPLYERLVDVLPVYLRPVDPRFHWFLDAMLLYEGDSITYWQKMEELAGRLVDRSSDSSRVPTQAAEETRNLGVFARALAQARCGKVQEAIANALLLQRSAEFPTRLERIFPANPADPQYLYGRAAVLFSARRRSELDAFFQNEVFQEPTPELEKNPYYHRATVLRGRNILDRWLATNHQETTLATPEAKIERDKTLAEARDTFQAYLERHPQDREIRLALGKVQELTEAYAAAFLSYAMLAREEAGDDEAFARIANLHAGHALPPPDMLEAWKVLRTYGGEKKEILAYIEKTRQALLAEALLYCPGCGRKGAEGDTMCLECGRKIGRLARTEPPPATD